MAVDVVDQAFPCPCCGYLTSSGPGSYDICTICHWEDDPSQLRFPDTGGANDMSLLEAQASFARIGAKGPSHLPHVRPARPDDARDPDWRPIIPAIDDVERPIPGTDYGRTYPADLTELYYWRPTFWRLQPRRA